MGLVAALGLGVAAVVAETVKVAKEAAEEAKKEEAQSKDIPAENVGGKPWNR